MRCQLQVCYGIPVPSFHLTCIRHELVLEYRRLQGKVSSTNTIRRSNHGSDSVLVHAKYSTDNYGMLAAVGTEKPPSNNIYLGTRSTFRPHGMEVSRLFNARGTVLSMTRTWYSCSRSCTYCHVQIDGEKKCDSKSRNHVGIVSLEYRFSGGISL